MERANKMIYVIGINGVGKHFIDALVANGFENGEDVLNGMGHMPGKYVWRESPMRGNITFISIRPLPANVYVILPRKITTHKALQSACNIAEKTHTTFLTEDYSVIDFINLVNSELKG